MIAGGLGANANIEIFTADVKAWKLLVAGVFGCVFFVGFAQIALLRNLKE